MKKLMSILLAMLMVFAMAAPAMAETVATTDVTIDDGGITNATYSAYKLLNATTAAAGADNTDEDDLFAYTLNEKYTAVLQSVTEATTQADIVAYIASLSGNDVQAFADAVYAAIMSKNITADHTSSGNKFALEYGYYLIAESVLGTIENGPTDTYSLVMLDTAGLQDVTVTTKEDVPSVVKKVKDTNDSTGATSDWQDSADHDIGDTINYQITGTVSDKYASYKSYYYSFTDTMSVGLTYNNDAKVYIVNDDVRTDVTTQFAFASLGEGSNGFTATANLKELTLSEGVSITDSTTVVVEYTCTLNEKAAIGAAGNPNTVYLEYENNPYHEGDGNPETPDKPETPGKTPDDKVIVFTYQTVVNKVNENNEQLAGAGFTLYKYDCDAEGEEKWVMVGEELKAEDGHEMTTFTWTGLDDGEYKLVETTTPAGYNTIADITFTVTAEHAVEADEPALTSLSVTSSADTESNAETGEVAAQPAFAAVAEAGTMTTSVVNKSGTELPETGGMGTTVLYIVGGVLVVGAVIVLVSKKKANEK